VSYKIVETARFKEKIEKLEKGWARIPQFRNGLHTTLARDPFSWGTPVPKEPNWKYGFYFVGKSDAIGRFPSFDIAYRVTDDTVYLLDIGAIKF
jgi:hypothetical protein